jgi:hypothetical protein
MAQLQSGPRVYFWPSALAEQRWTSWRSPLDTPQLMRAIALEGHQRIERGDGTFDSEWRVHGRFRHDDDMFMQEAADAAEFKATLWVSAAETAGDFECNMHNAIMQDSFDPENDFEFHDAIQQYFDLLMETSDTAARAALQEWLAESASYTAYEQRQRQREAQMAQDDARYDAIQAVAEAPAERLAAIMAAATTPPAPAAPPAPVARPPAAAAAAPAASPRATRATSSSPASPAASAAPTAAGAARSPPSAAVCGRVASPGGRGRKRRAS